ncbi:hypothetical protein BH11GEM1_BH11GEM1_14200 [soil metagenome]
MLEPRFLVGRGFHVSAELSPVLASLYRDLMSVTVLLFASYADALGVPSVSLELPEGATVNDVLADIAARPGGGVLPARPLVAVNQRYAAPSTPVRSGDEVALIPPVAGG